MPKAFTELVVDQIAAHLTVDLPGVLSALSAEYGDGLSLPAPGEYIVGDRATTGAFGFPVVWVLGGSGEVELEETFNQLNFAYGYWRHRVRVQIAMVDPDDPDLLRRRLYRYAQAAIKVIRNHEGYEGGVSDWVRCRPVGFDLDQLYQHTTRSEFRQDIWVGLEVSRAE